MLEHADSTSSVAPHARGSPLEAWIAYLVTSALLAAAWHVAIPFGLWTFNAAAALFGIALALHTIGANWKQLLGCSQRNAAIGIASGLLLAIATQGAARAVLPLLPVVATETQRLYAILNQPPGAHWAAPIILLVVVAEELVYRGVVTSLCHRRWSRWGAIVGATALYVVPLTASGSWLLVAIGASLGLLWTAARLYSHSLLVPLLMHGIWSAATFVILPLL